MIADDSLVKNVIPSPHFFPGRYGYAVKWIIVHGTAGMNSADDVDNMFAGSNPVASHYTIDPTGYIDQSVSESDGAWANGGVTGPSGVSGDGVHHDAWWDNEPNPNLVTISIEFVKPSIDNSNNITPAQKDAGFKLIHSICQRNNIPARKADANGGITGHFSMDPVNRSQCPGTFPFDELWTYLKPPQTPQQEEELVIELNTPGVSEFLGPAANGMWRALRDGLHIGGAILSFYKRDGNSGLCGLTSLGLPLTEEINPNIAGFPEIRIQRFERGVLAYDPHHKLDTPPGSQDVYHTKLYEGLGQDPKVATLTADLHAEQAKEIALKNQLTSLQTQEKALQDKIDALTKELSQKPVDQVDQVAESAKASLASLLPLIPLIQQCAEANKPAQ